MSGWDVGLGKPQRVSRGLWEALEWALPGGVLPCAEMQAFVPHFPAAPAAGLERDRLLKALLAGGQQDLPEWESGHRSPCQARV